MKQYEIVSLKRLKKMLKRDILLYFNYWRNSPKIKEGTMKQIYDNFTKEYIILNTFSQEDLEKMTKKEIIHLYEVIFATKNLCERMSLEMLFEF